MISSTFLDKPTRVHLSYVYERRLSLFASFHVTDHRRLLSSVGSCSPVARDEQVRHVPPRKNLAQARLVDQDGRDGRVWEF